MAGCYSFRGRLQFNDDGTAVYTKAYGESSVNADRMMNDFRAYCQWMDAACRARWQPDGGTPLSSVSVSQYMDHVSDVTVILSNGVTHVRIEATES